MPRNGSGILITRTQPGADRLAADLAAKGHVPFVSPLLAISATHAPAPALAAVTACLVTSSHAATMAAADPAWQTLKNLPLYCTGETTARTLAAAGAGNVIHGTGGVAEACSLMKDAGVSGTVLHIRGADIAPGTAPALATLGCTLAEWTVYETMPANVLDAGIARALGNGAIQAAMFHSAAGAAVFARLVRTSAFEGHLSGVAALCISANVLDSLSMLPFAALYVSDVPSSDGMMALVSRHVPA